MSFDMLFTTFSMLLVYCDCLLETTSLLDLCYTPYYVLYNALYCALYALHIY